MGFITTGKRSVPLYKRKKHLNTDPVKKRKTNQTTTAASIHSGNSPRQSMSLEDLPINVLHLVFVLAGPGNSLPLTSKFCNRIFKVRDAGESHGAWPNSDLAISMIKSHYMIPLNMDDPVPLDENMSRISSRIQDIRLTWRNRGNDIASLQTDSHFKGVVSCMGALELQVDSFKVNSHALDVRVLSHRFFSKEFFDCFINRATLLGSSHSRDTREPDSKVLITSKEVGERESRTRVHFILFKIKEISFHLDALEDRINKDEINEPARDANAALIEAHNGSHFRELEACVEGGLQATNGSKSYYFDTSKDAFVYANPMIDHGTPFPMFYFQSGDELIKLLPLLDKLREYGFYLQDVDAASNSLITFYEPRIMQGDQDAATELNEIIKNLISLAAKRTLRSSTFPITRLMTIYHDKSKEEANEQSSYEILCCLKRLIQKFYEPHEASDDRPLWECVRKLKDGVLAPMLLEMCKDSENGYKCIFK